MAIGVALPHDPSVRRQGRKPGRDIVPVIGYLPASGPVSNPVWAAGAKLRPVGQLRRWMEGAGEGSVRLLCAALRAFGHSGDRLVSGQQDESLVRKPSDKQSVRIAITDANFRTAVELTTKGRFDGWGLGTPVDTRAADSLATGGFRSSNKADKLAACSCKGTAC